MKKILFTLSILLSACQLFFAQDYSRKQLDYSKMTEKKYTDCDSFIYTQLNTALLQLENLQSEQAVIISKKAFDKTKACPQVYEVYGWSLFRNGKREEGLAIIEEGITLFGNNPDLISRRAFIGLEMAELGVAQKSIDGNGVYVSGDNVLKYDEEKFKTENYKTALYDFEYICENYENRFREIMIKGYILQQLGEFEKSNAEFSKLFQVPEYSNDAVMRAAGNYIQLKQYEKAEMILLDMQKKTPRDISIQESLGELYNIKGDSVLMMESRKRSYFFKLTPANSDLEYNKDNYNAIVFFASEENNSKSKTEKLKQIIKEKDNSYAVDVCLSILKMHANHGNGLEETARKELITKGKTAVPKTILLLQNDEVSTCTITNVADVLASIKDTSGWMPLVNYLPVMANMPFTVIPPNVPEMLMKFDKEKATRILIEFVKQLIQMEAQTIDTGNPMAELGSFGQYVFYSPLKEVKKEKVIQIAKEYNYTEEELKTLLKKIYG